MSMMGNPMDLEILSGLDALDDDGGMMGYDAFNALAGGYDDDGDAMLGAMMGFNPLSWIRNNPLKAAGIGAGAVGAGLLARRLMQGRKQQAIVNRANQIRAAQVQQQLAQSPYAQPQPLSMLVSQVPGVSSRGTKVQPLGFQNGVFTATSGTTITVRARPQRPLRGGRLVGSFARGGTSATGLLTLVSLFVGTDGQLLSGDPISFDALSPNAFGVGVNLTPAAVGQEIVATVAVSAAPTMTDTITFNLTLFGMSLG